MPALLTAIVAQPFFKGLSEQHLRMLAESAMHTEFAPRQSIFRTGDPPNRFYLIERGKVAVELEVRAGEPIRIETLGPGREIGWSWILQPEHYEQFSTTALEATDAIFFYGTRLRQQCEENHDFGYEMMKRMAVVMLHRIQAGSVQLLESQGKHS